MSKKNYQHENEGFFKESVKLNPQIKSNNIKNHHQFQNKSQAHIKILNQKDSCSIQYCLFHPLIKRELRRVFFIPLLIILFLLIITLTFKQNYYQTNDYFYSKNIQINRKIRGIVPPLNQTKADIFGTYQIGLIQAFNVENRRIFSNFTIQMWRNESMKITEEGKQAKCWALYKLKFYSSTLFIQKIKNHLTTNFAAGKSEQIINNLADPKNLTSVQSSKANQQKQSSLSADLQNQKLSQSTLKQNNIIKQNSFCSLEQWTKLNEILFSSHIWTFSEGNFYLLKFSEVGDDDNGVLIMSMNEKYPLAQ